MYSSVICEHVQKRLEETHQRLMWLLELEDPPLTLNNHYYADYKDKFMTYYRSAASERNSSLADKLQKWAPLNSGDNDEDAFRNGVAEMLSGAPKVGLAGLKATDLARLLPASAQERALKIMAEVRAYFQGQ
jgi:hypothetical protein